MTGKMTTLVGDRPERVELRDVEVPDSGEEWDTARNRRGSRRGGWADTGSSSPTFSGLRDGVCPAAVYPVAGPVLTGSFTWTVDPTPKSDA